MVIIALLALILAAALVEYFYVESATLRLTEALERVQRALSDGDGTAAQYAARDFSAQWENEKQRLETLFDHSDVDMISAAAKRIEAYCGEGDTTDALAEVSSGLFYISHLRGMIGLRWENIL